MKSIECYRTHENCNGSTCNHVPPDMQNVSALIDKAKREAPYKIIALIDGLNEWEGSFYTLGAAQSCLERLKAQKHDILGVEGFSL